MSHRLRFGTASMGLTTKIINYSFINLSSLMIHSKMKMIKNINLLSNSALFHLKEIKIVIPRILSTSQTFSLITSKWH